MKNLNLKRIFCLVRTLSLGCLIIGNIITLGLSQAAEPTPAASVGTQTSPSSESTQPSSEQERNFYQVLDELLDDFEFDLKSGTPNSSEISHLSIRNIAVSETVPSSFKNHIELLVTERILKITKAKVIQCAPCRARKTSVSGDHMVMSSPETNPSEMARIAQSAGIEHFMDIAFTYQPTGMFLSMTLTDPNSSSVIWSRNYNSEMSRASAARRGVDYSQIDDERKFTEYQPLVQYRTTVYYLSEPSVDGSVGTLGFGLRMVERFDNRKKEVGFELNYLNDASSLAGKKQAQGTLNLYSGFNLTLLFMHAWNLIGSEENFNTTRSSIILGAGGTYASGFLGALVRTQYELRFGKHYAVSATAGYRPETTQFLSGTPAGKVSGVEFGLGIHLLF